MTKGESMQDQIVMSKSLSWKLSLNAYASLLSEVEALMIKYFTKCPVRNYAMGLVTKLKYNKVCLRFVWNIFLFLCKYIAN